MKNIIVTIIALFLSTFATAQALEGFETRTYTVKFKCNSSTISYNQAEELDFLMDSTITITQISGYASVEGDSAKNDYLSFERATQVASLLNQTNAEITWGGETTHLGKSLSLNRAVVITYVVKATNTSNNTNVGSISKTANAEGFNCGNHIDPATYLADTLVEETTVAIPATIVVKPIVLTPTTNTALAIAPIVRDTQFLPINEAIKFQMEVNGMSRSEAVKSVKQRKSQWKEIEPKAKTSKKVKAKKVKMKRTRGVNRSLFVRVFPFAGC